MKRYLAAGLAALMIAGCSPAGTGAEPTQTMAELAEPVREIGDQMLAVLDGHMAGDIERGDFMDKAIELLAELEHHDASYIYDRFDWAAAGVFGGVPDVVEASRDELAVALGADTKYEHEQSAAELVEFYTAD